MKMEDRVHPVLVAVALIAMVAFVVLLSSAGVLEPSSEIKYGISRDRTPPPAVTWSEFDKLQRGMTHAAVIGTLGAVEDLRSHSIRDDGSPVEVLSWFNPDGSSVTLTLLNAYLVQIEESELPRPST